MTHPLHVTHPYETIPSESYWRSGVVETDRNAWPNIYVPKYRIGRDTAVATAGSWFSEHLGTYLRLSGGNLLESEPAPKGMRDELARQFGFGRYSARFGEIATARQLRELLSDVMDGHVDERLFWTREGRWFDAARPDVEPYGCDTRREAMELRREHLVQVAALVQATDVFVFTLAEGEGWIDSHCGRAMAQGAKDRAEGQPPAHSATYHKFTYEEIFADLTEILRLLRLLNKKIKLVLTVSPVPHTSASGQHVLAANTYSKAMLRAAAGALAEAEKAVDYFPSYEIVTTWAAPDAAFCDTQTAVRPEVMERAIEVFLVSHGLLEATEAPRSAPSNAFDDDFGPDFVGDFDDEPNEEEDALICEEALLEALRK